MHAKRALKKSSRTWQRRGFCSLNGCVTAISMDTGKILEVEPLIKQIHGSKMSITGAICNTFG